MQLINFEKFYNNGVDDELHGVLIQNLFPSLFTASSAIDLCVVNNQPKIVRMFFLNLYFDGLSRNDFLEEELLF